MTNTRKERTAILYDLAARLLRVRGSYMTGDPDWGQIIGQAANALTDEWARDWGRDEEPALAALDVLGVLDALRAGVDEAMVGQVAVARAQGASWADVGRAVGGLTKQGAQQRWG